jgi:hypothetical protein
MTYVSQHKEAHIVLVGQLDHRQRGGEEASWSAGKHSARSFNRFLSVSKTLSQNWQECAASFKK